MTTDQWFEIIKILLQSATVLGLAWIGVIHVRTHKSQIQAATKVEEVRTTLESSTARTDTKLDEVHHLVNGAMGSQLKITAMLAKRLADISGHADDIKAAEMAQTAWAEHEKNGLALDADKGLR